MEDDDRFAHRSASVEDEYKQSNVFGGRLRVEGMELRSLPPIPSYVTAIYCGNNRLTSLPELPDTVEELYCEDNQLTSLPRLPKRLRALRCGENKLTSLPELPPSLLTLDCNKNPLQSLPVLPRRLHSLDCNTTLIKALPLIPNSLTFLRSSHCPNLEILDTTKCEDRRVDYTFEDCPKLSPQPNAKEKFCDYLARYKKEREERASKVLSAELPGPALHYLYKPGGPMAKKVAERTEFGKGRKTRRKSSKRRRTRHKKYHT